MKNESAVVQAFRQHVPSYIMWRRIEDSSGSLGTPDIILMGNGKCLWVEAKFGGPNAKPQMRAGQSAFAFETWKVNIPTLVLMGHPDGSAKLIDGRTVGDDWKDWLICRTSRLSLQFAQGILEYLTGCGEENAKTDIRTWTERLRRNGD